MVSVSSMGFRLGVDAIERLLGGSNDAVGHAVSGAHELGLGERPTRAGLDSQKVHVEHPAPDAQGAEIAAPNGLVRPFAGAEHEAGNRWAGDEDHPVSMGSPPTLKQRTQLMTWTPAASPAIGPRRRT